jgi:serine protease Do
MRGKTILPVVLLAILIMVFVSACGSTPETQAQPAVTDAPVKKAPTAISEPTATEVPSGLVTSLPDLKKATIQIEAEGTFIDPEFGYMANAAGRGSGFIIDPSGLAVTNNHVVTGAGLLQVWVGGDKNKAYNARILGVSECSDLALIDIEGDGFPYLSWYDGQANVGLQVFSAGFPLGDPEYTLTNGIVSKENADGETSWASVDSVIEHTATINPGNSGGPLVDTNANVVGVNYAGSSTTNQYFAINRETVLPVIEQLKTGKDVDSIGINGEAVVSEDGTISGLWVSSVESGSPADKAGVKAGDIILSLENIYLATDGTMNEYCDILRTKKPEDTMALQVLRWSNGDILEGQLNGRNLEVVSSLQDTSDESSGTTDDGTVLENCVTSSVSGWITCYDDTGTLQLDVPDYWTDVVYGPWVLDGQTIGVSISAAPSLSDFQSYFDAEGVFFGASDTFAQYGGYVQVLDYYTGGYSGDCTLVGRYDYNDGVYRGKYDSYSDCGGIGGYDAYVLSAIDIVNPTAAIIVLEIQTYPGDTATVEQIWNTFYVYY